VISRLYNVSTGLMEQQCMHVHVNETRLQITDLFFLVRRKSNSIITLQTNKQKTQTLERLREEITALSEGCAIATPLPSREDARQTRAVGTVNVDGEGLGQTALCGCPLSHLVLQQLLVGVVAVAVPLLLKNENALGDLAIATPSTKLLGH
jgi:hypothetical protein